jgi:hypothetical protein
MTSGARVVPAKRMARVEPQHPAEIGKFCVDGPAQPGLERGLHAPGEPGTRERDGQLRIQVAVAIAGLWARSRGDGRDTGYERHPGQRAKPHDGRRREQFPDQRHSYRAAGRGAAEPAHACSNDTGGPGPPELRKDSAMGCGGIIDITH